MKSLRHLDLAELGLVIWGICALGIVGVIFGIGVAVGRWFA